MTMSSWITESKGWETMNKMLLATVSGGCRFSGGGGGSRALKKLVRIPPGTITIALTP